MPFDRTMNIPTVPDLRYPEILGYNINHLPNANRLKSQFLRPLAEAFCDNLIRNQATGHVIPFYSWIGMRFQRAASEAEHAILSKPVQESEQRDDPAVMRKIFEETQRRLVKLAALDLMNPVGSEVSILKGSMGNVPTFLKIHPGLNHGTKAILASMIVNAWTAFEVLADDLWHTAENNVAASVAKKLTSIPDKGFRTLSKIKKAYSGFGADTETLFETVEGGYITVLSAARNCLVHQSGVIDAQCLGQLGRFPEFGVLKQGSDFPVDGPLVVRLSHVSAILGATLLRHVDEWLLQQPSS